MLWIYIYFVFLITGIGFSQYFLNGINKLGSVGLLFVSPLFGASLLIVESGFLAIGWFTLERFVEVAVATSIISMLIFLNTTKKKLLLTRVSFCNYPAHRIALTFILAIGILLIGYSLNPNQNNVLSVRLGIDIPAYASATFSILNQPINATSSIFSNEILHNAHRWGVPALSAFLISTALINASVYDFLFGVVYALFVSGVLSIAYIFFRAYKSVWTSRNETGAFALFIFIALSLVLNSAQLNFIHEGFYPQIISTVLLCLALSIFLLLREEQKYELPTIIFAGVIWGAIAITYSEALVLGMAFVMATFFFDFCLDRQRVRIDAVFAMSLILGLFLAFPVSKDLVRFTLANTGNVGSIGYTQPNWMFPSELIGLGSIYDHAESFFDDAVATHIVKRSLFLLVVTLAMSFAAFKFSFRGATYLKDRVFFLSIILIVFLIFACNFAFAHMGLMPAGYAYNKLSSLLSPLLVGMFTFGLFCISRRNIFWMGVAFLAVITLSGFKTVNDRDNLSVKVDMDSLNIINNKLKTCMCVLMPMERGRRNAGMVGKLRYVDRTSETVISTALNVPIIDQWNLNTISSFSDGMRIFLLVNKNNINPSVINSKKILDSRGYLVVNSGVTVGEFKIKTATEKMEWISLVSRNLL